MTARVGLVLGAGGAIGRAFHAGVLAALETVTGFDAREAAVIAGTSAGSVDGSLLRAGLAPHDLLARVTDQPLTPEGRDLLAGFATWSPPEETGESQRWRPASTARLLAAARRPWAATPGSIFAAFMPEGRRLTTSIEHDIDRLFAGSWPAKPMWICAVRLDDGERIVFGRDPSPQASVGQAVAASCAIPGYFAPTQIGRSRYVDGGVHSPTNADLMAGNGLDLVIICSPMTAEPGALRLSPDGAFRAACRVLLRREAAHIRRRGTQVTLVEPVVENLTLMGRVISGMDATRRTEVAFNVYESMRKRLEHGPMGERLAPWLRSSTRSA